MPKLNDQANKKTQPEQLDISGAFFLIDGNSLAYRAFYALPESIATSEGFPTNALLGFSTMLTKIITDYQPAGLVVAWDTGKKVFRHHEYEDYKAGRKPMPDALSQQFPRFEELVAAFGFANLKKEGYEADDVLATLARELKQQGQTTVIVTADRDALQLVDQDVYVMSNTKGISEVKVYDPGAVVARFGIAPAQIPDFIGLKGDTSDNIPGIPGVGDKTAASLLADYASLEELVGRRQELKGKRRQLLDEYHEQALKSKELAVLNDEVPVEFSAELLLPAAPDRERLRQELLRYEFNSLVRRLEELGLIEAPVGATRHLGLAAVEPIRLVQALYSGSAPLALAEEQRAENLRLALYGAGDDRVQLAVAAPEQWVELLRTVRAPDRLPPLFCHDYKKLLSLLPQVPGCFHDTMVAAYLLKPTAKTYNIDQLAAAADLRLEVADGRPGERHLALKAAQTLLLGQEQQKQLERLGLSTLFRQVEMPVVEVLAEMESLGVRLDLPRLGELSLKVSDQLAQLSDEIYQLAGGEFNLGSPQQLAAVLFERLGLPPGKKGKTGYSTDASVLKALREAHPIVAKIESNRELAKLSSTYLQALPKLADPDTWRIHTTFNQTVTTTGRLSSSNPNLQNIPIRTPLGEKIRDCFIAEEGWLLLAADYSQVELRVMAHLSGEEKLRAAFRAGEDVHRATAAEVFKLSLEEVTAKERGRAKAVNFGIMYGISPFGLAEQLDISQEEAASYIESYLARYPQVASFRERTIEAARQDGFVTTIMGRRRPIPELKSQDDRIRKLGQRLAVNTVIQGSAADIIKLAMVGCHRSLAKQKLAARLVLQVHDELVFEAPRAEIEAVGELARREMIAAYDLDPPLVVDVGIGETWVEAK